MEAGTYLERGWKTIISLSRYKQTVRDLTVWGVSLTRQFDEFFYFSRKTIFLNRPDIQSVQLMVQGAVLFRPNLGK